MPKFGVIFNKLAYVTIDAKDEAEANEIANKMLETEDDLDWTEADIQEIDRA